MNKLSLVGVCAAVVLSIPVLSVAQTPPQDDPNPPWKAELEKKPTPRGPDGKPILVGMWQRSGTSFLAERGPLVESRTRQRSGNDAGVQRWLGRGEGADIFINYERDSGVAMRGAENKPLYKPDWWERVQYNDLHGNKEDPTMSCMLFGVPRTGPPERIAMLAPDEYIFMYGDGSSPRARYTQHRLIPMNKPHPPKEQWEGTSWLGIPSAHWEGDTLVVESVDFGELSWLEYPGYVHSLEMTVTERYTRIGDVLKWEVTVNDPDALLEPWVWNPWYLRINPDPNARIKEQAPCKDYDRDHLNTERG
jgi:hypothetical protein